MKQYNTKHQILQLCIVEQRMVQGKIIQHLHPYSTIIHIRPEVNQETSDGSERNMKTMPLHTMAIFMTSFVEPKGVGRLICRFVTPFFGSRKCRKWVMVYSPLLEFN